MRAKYTVHGNKMNGTEFSQTVYDQFINLFVLPEIQRRKQQGELKGSFDLKAAQILFFGDGRKPIVRINSEVKAIATVKKKAGISRQAGELVYEHELEAINGIKLTEEEDPNCGHAILLRLNNIWYIFFDFRYNKAHSLKCLETAREFYEIAKFAFKQKHLKPFADNLFSAAELIVKSTLLSFPNPKFVKKTSHTDIQMKYNRFAKLGNVKSTYRETFNKLSGLRIDARYLKKEITVTEEEGQKLLDIVKEMLENGFTRIK